MRKPLLLLASGLTLVGVPAGLALTGGWVDGSSTAALAVLLAGLVLLLGRRPVTVLVISLCWIAALRGAELIGAGAVWPATAAFVAVLVEGRQRIAVTAGAVALCYGFVWDHFVQLQPLDAAVARSGVESLWLTAALAIAFAYVSTRRWQDEVAGRLRQTLAQQEDEARRRRAEERVDIARDLHDVVSHTLAVVGVHLHVALDAFDDDPAEARAAMRLAQDIRGRAMADLKTLVAVLRLERGPAGDEPARGLEGLAALVERVRGAGLEVELAEEGDREQVPAAVAITVHRVVQEALTNTVRHARAARVEVRMHYRPDMVELEIVDDGAGGGAPREGHGILGMRERVAALGGALTAGPAPNAGFAVRATIPVAV